jgi:hypothetical protein
MSKKKAPVTELTDAHRALFPKYVEKWTKFALNCEPCDFEKAKDAAARAYEAAGLEKPFIVVLTDSPQHCALSAVLFFETVDPAKRKWTKKELAKAADESVEKARNIILDGGITDELKTKISNEAHAMIYGSHDAAWAGYYDFAWTELADPETEKLQPLVDLAKVCGWWAPYEGICFLQHRHTEIHFTTSANGNKRFHNPKGPAVLYRDGFAVYAFNGVRVKPWIIENPEKITVQTINAETNAEVRRVMTELYPGGAEQLLKDMKGELVHKDEYADLYSVKVGDEEHFIASVTCPSTQRGYHLRIDGTQYNGRAGREGRAAIASTWRKNDGTVYFKTPEEYMPDVQT